MSTAVVLFTRDLRVHDNPALHAAVRSADAIVPLFVLDEAILRGPFARPNRVTFLVDSLRDLRRSLRRRGADLVVRSGDVLTETTAIADAVGADQVHLMADVTAFARRRVSRLQQGGLDVLEHPGVTVVPPGRPRPYKVFTPYWRAWQAQSWRQPAPAPRAIALAAGVAPGRIPTPASIAPGALSPALPSGGETAGRRRMLAWLRASEDGYASGGHDDLAGDRTSRLSPWLHFGCLSPLELASRSATEAFVRQLCWRDFHHQVAATHPSIATEDYRPRGRRWRTDDHALQGWKDGATGVPLVDAAMHQLRHEGWVHNRARLVAASWLTKTMGVDWRLGAAHFLDWLVDGDIVNNSANWQWVAGTGTDTRPNRVLNPERQARRHDPDGVYVDRWRGR